MRKGCKSMKLEEIIHKQTENFGIRKLIIKMEWFFLSVGMKGLIKVFYLWKFKTKAKEDTYLQKNSKIISAENLQFWVNQEIF